MNYQQTVDYLYSLLPNWQRQGGAAYKANLNNSLALDNALGHPHRAYPCIHVAGTNGKGSVSHMLAAALTGAGYKTGLYTSPHMLDFRERIRIDGVPVPKMSVIHFVRRHRALIQTLKPSFFELTVALAFDWFARQKVDVAVIECGLGGRLDSTNIITPLVSVITNVSFDHTEFLGSDLATIAAEKAGIIKPGVPVVVGQADSLTSPVFVAKARENDSPVFFVEQLYRGHLAGWDFERGIVQIDVELLSEGSRRRFELDLPGSYQRFNLPVALCVTEILKQEGFVRLSDDNSLVNSILHTASATGLMGRWQILARKPLLIADIAHNEAGLRELMAATETLEKKRLHIVLGMVKEKETARVLPHLPVDATYYFVSASNPRSLDAQSLGTQASAYGLVGEAYPAVSHGLEAAKKQATANDVILVTGSTFVVADVLLQLTKRRR